LLSITAWLSSAIVGLAVKNTLLNFLISGVFYTACCAALLYLLPSLVSMTSSEMRLQVRVAWLRLKVR
jgi:multisubunit Na+/H+ antiporter MnhE subunit